MPTSLAFADRYSAPAVLCPLAILFAAACGEGANGTSSDSAADGSGADDSGVASVDDDDGSGGGGSVDAGSDAADVTGADSSTDSATGTGESGDPPNPLGRGPAPVDLGDPTDLAAPGAYVLLAKTGITNATGSSISGGHLGLSPAAASFVTGFSLMADPSDVFSTSDSVVAPSRIYASDYTSPTPVNLTSAILGMQTAYTDAAGRTNPDFLDLDSGEIGGLTLEPGLYAWSTSVTIPDDVTIAGGENDVWIFQISNDLHLSTAKQVLLAEGAQPRNIFWQVAGQVTIQANAHFEGIILSQTAITLQTNATMNGRALAQSLVAIDDNDVTAPSP